MTRDLNAANLKPGDVLTAHDHFKTINGIAPMTNKWIVLTNNLEDDYIGKYVEVYVLYSSSLSVEKYSFYYNAFKKYQQKLVWRLEHVS
jgi:hypothetical protein